MKKLISLNNIKLCLFVIATGLLSACGPEKPKSPEELAFINADNKILVYEKETAFGNTPEALAMAQRFSVVMEGFQKIMFTGGGKVHAFTGSKFLTYCQVSKNEVIFLCHVPGMKNYKGEARDALGELAWAAGKQAASKLHETTRLVIALKGDFIYGPVWYGTIAKNPTIKTSGLDALEPFFSSFLE